MAKLRDRISEYFFGTRTLGRLSYFQRFNSELYTGDQDCVAKRNVELFSSERWNYSIFGKCVPNLLILMGISAPILACIRGNDTDSILFGTAAGFLELVIGETYRNYVQHMENGVIIANEKTHSRNVQLLRDWDMEGLLSGDLIL